MDGQTDGDAPQLVEKGDGGGKKWVVSKNVF